MTTLEVTSRPKDRRQVARHLHVVFATLLCVTSVCSLAIGASGTSLWAALWQVATGESITLIDWVVLWEIRAPRTLLGLSVGAALAMSGAVMQGLFRHPLADPGLLGVSAGATLGAIAAIVLGAVLHLGLDLCWGAHFCLCLLLPVPLWRCLFYMRWPRAPDGLQLRPCCLGVLPCLPWWPLLSDC